MCKKIILLFAVMITALTGCSSESELTISVASSLINPMNEIIEIYEEENNIEVNVNFGSSGSLKKQIENGANIDLFFSANENYINDLVNSNIVKNDNITYPMYNSLVLIKNKNANMNFIEDIINNDLKLALGELSTVPLGQYSKEALESLNIYDDIKSNIIYAKDATTVISYVESGNVDSAVIYKSDVDNLENSEVIYEFDKDSHQNIKYSLVNITENQHTNDLIELINSNKGKEIFRKYGFDV